MLPGRGRMPSRAVRTQDVEDDGRDDLALHRALTAGVQGYVLKTLPPEELIAAVKAAARGDAYVDPAVVRRLTPRIADAVAPIQTAAPELPPGMAQLTAREREVFLLLSEGFTNQEIAASLFVGDETVKSHVSRIFMKLEVRDRVHAVRYAYRHGIVQVTDGPDD